jgi:hypothetical protein
MMDNNYVGYCRYIPTADPNVKAFVACGSKDNGAFKVYHQATIAELTEKLAIEDEWHIATAKDMTQLQTTIADLTARLEKAEEWAVCERQCEGCPTPQRVCCDCINSQFSKERGKLATAQAQLKRLGEAVEDLSLAYKGTVMTDRQVFAWDTIKAALANGKEGIKQ